VKNLNCHIGWYFLLGNADKGIDISLVVSAASNDEKHSFKLQYHLDIKIIIILTFNLLIYMRKTWITKAI
jgi:hypothetical protein